MFLKMRFKLAEAQGRSKELRDVRLGKHFPEKYDVVVMGDVQVKDSSYGNLREVIRRSRY